MRQHQLPDPTHLHSLHPHHPSSTRSQNHQLATHFGESHQLPTWAQALARTVESELALAQALERVLELELAQALERVLELELAQALERALELALERVLELALGLAPAPLRVIATRIAFFQPLLK